MEKLLLVILVSAILLTGCISPNDCEKISETEIRDICYSTIALTSTDDTVCEKIHNKTIGDLCYLTIAQTTTNQRICEKIQNKTMKDDCYLMIAQTILNPEICEKINNSEKKDICIQEIPEAKTTNTTNETTNTTDKTIPVKEKRIEFTTNKATYAIGENITVYLTFNEELYINPLIRIYRIENNTWKHLGMWDLKGGQYTCCGAIPLCEKHNISKSPIRIQWNQKAITEPLQDTAYQNTTPKQVSFGRYRIRALYGEELDCTEHINIEFMVTKDSHHTK